MKTIIILLLLSTAANAQVQTAPAEKQLSVALPSGDWQWLLNCMTTSVCYPATNVNRIGQSIYQQVQTQLVPPKPEKEKRP